ncbi:MAG: hypothetical protein EBR82_86475 [Caulobacteraceae bacterium]|nr:hypothetical protein [Caulobacteraceae bacterium]
MRKDLQMTDTSTDDRLSAARNAAATAARRVHEQQEQIDEARAIIDHALSFLSIDRTWRRRAAAWLKANDRT